VETVPGVPATATAAAVPAAVKVTLAAASELRVESTQESATTGTVDARVAIKRIEVEAASSERKWLLWTAIACGVLGVLAFVIVKEWPVIGKGLLTASGLAFLAWKVSDVPSWAFVLALASTALCVFIYKRAEWDRDGDGIPDILETKSKQQTQTGRKPMTIQKEPA
jgi:hypothetical protein